MANGRLKILKGCLEFHVRAFHLLRKLLDPAFVHFNFALQGICQQVPDRLDHGVGNADIEGAADWAELDMESRVDYHFVGRDNVGQPGVHFSPDIFEIERIHRPPGLAIAVQRQIEQPFDDALFSLGEVPPFHAHVVSTVAAEQVVNNQEHQFWVEHEQGCTAQGFHQHQVDVGRYWQMANELAIFLDLYRPHRDVGTAAHEGQQSGAQVPCKTLIDDFQRMHAATHHMVIRPKLVNR